MNKGKFRFVKYDEAGVEGNSENRRLVCVTGSGDKVAIWGNKANMRNIDTVRQAGLPCTVECQYRNPSEFAAQRFGHIHWVRQDMFLRVIQSGGCDGIVKHASSLHTASKECL